MRTCSSCGESRSEGDFHKAGKRLSSSCKACESMRKKQSRLERKAAGVTATHGTCLTCGGRKPAAEFRKNWAHASGLEFHCRICVSHNNRQRLFGLTPEEYQAKLAEQGGRCAICGQQERTRANNGMRIKDLAVDHDHATGRVRGLLCANCNKGIGNLGEDVDRLIAAARYLLEYSDEMRATSSAEAFARASEGEVI